MKMERRIEVKIKARPDFYQIFVYCYATITDDSLLAWVSAWISERPGHITAYKENAFEDALIPSDDKTWMTFDKFLAI